MKCGPESHRVDENEGSQVSVGDALALEPDHKHIAVAGLETERSGHLHESAEEQSRKTEER